MANLDTSGAVKAAKRARAARSAGASGAARNATSAAQATAASLGKGAREKIIVARAWAAPRLESAADYTASTVAPKVCGALRTTARQVSPTPKKNSTRTVLTWSVLGAAIAAAAGAVAAALLRSRYRAAIDADTEAADEEVLGDSTGSKPAPVTPERTATPSGPGPEASVNGRVTASGR